MNLGAYLHSADENPNFYGVKLATNSEIDGRANIKLGDPLDAGMTYQERVKACYKRCQDHTGDRNIGMCIFFLVPTAGSSDVNGAMNCWAESFAEVGKYRTENGDHKIYRNDHFDVYSRYDINIATYEHFGVGRTINTDHYNPIDTTKACWYAMNMHFNMHYNDSTKVMGYQDDPDFSTTNGWTYLHSRVYQEGILTQNQNLPLGCFLTAHTRSYVNEYSPNSLTYTVGNQPDNYNRPDWIMSNSNIHPFECKCTTKRTHCVDSLQLHYYCSGVMEDGTVTQLEDLDAVTEEEAVERVQSNTQFVSHFCCLESYDCSSKKNKLLHNYENVFLSEEYIAENHVVYVKKIKLNYHASDYDEGHILPEISCKLLCNNEPDCDGIFYGNDNVLLNEVTTTNIDFIRFPIDSCYFTKIISKTNIEHYTEFDRSFLSIKFGENLQTLSNFRSEININKCRELVVKHKNTLPQVQKVQIPNTFVTDIYSVGAPFGCLYDLDGRDLNSPPKVNYYFNRNSYSNILCGVGVFTDNVEGYYCIIDANQNAILGNTGIDFHPKSWIIHDADNGPTTCEQLGLGSYTMTQADCATIINKPVCTTDEYNGPVPYGCSSLFMESSESYCMLYSTSITEEGMSLCANGVIKATEFEYEKRITCYCRVTEEYRNTATVVETSTDTSIVILNFGNNGATDYIYNSQNDPDITLCLNQVYEFRRTTSGHALRVVKDTDCTGCSTGTYSSLPFSSDLGWSDVTMYSPTDFTFTSEGTYYYVCTAHTAMVGKIIVTTCESDTVSTTDTASTSVAGAKMNLPLQNISLYVKKDTIVNAKYEVPDSVQKQGGDSSYHDILKFVKRKYSNSNFGVYSNKCTQCPDGREPMFPGSLFCLESCDQGQFYDTESQTCSSCETGKYQDFKGQYNCKNCVPGKFGDVTGLIQCKECPTGKFGPNPVATSCTECVVGQYQDQTKQTSCKTCLPGKFQSSTGQSSCTNCAIGQYQGSHGTTSCANCPTGRAQFYEGQSSCSACARGKYQNQNGQSTCKNCGGGQYSTGGVSSCSNCPSGKWQRDFGQASCKNCEGGTYQDQSGQTTCKICPQGQYQNSYGQSSCKGVSTGYYTKGARQTQQYAGCRATTGSDCWYKTCPCYNGASRGYGDCDMFHSRHSYSTTRCYSCWCFFSCSTCCDTTHYYWFYADC